MDAAEDRAVGRAANAGSDRPRPAHRPAGLDAERGGILSLDAVPGADGDRSVAALLAIQDALALAGARPVLIVGTGAGFVIDGALRDAAARELLARTCALLADHPSAVIAAAEGSLLDAGLELALACDLRFAATGAAVGMPGAREGWLPVGGGQRLTRLGGSSLAARMLLLGETPRCGQEPQLERVLTRAEAPARAGLDALAQLRASGPLAVEAMKSALRAAADGSLAAGLEIEADLACLLLPTADRAEGVAALLERRPPTFDGR